jgi:hypothetical protein
MFEKMRRISLLESSPIAVYERLTVGWAGSGYGDGSGRGSGYGDGSGSGSGYGDGDYKELKEGEDA